MQRLLVVVCVIFSLDRCGAVVFKGGRKQNGDDEMRTDERTGQAAKHALKSLQDKVQRERMMSRDGNFLFMSQDKRQKTAIQIDILKQVCGIEWKEG